ncbi:MAG: hypothetical protein VX917_03385, partial [Chloroflexota bacterium]|nr:hypothetical protein [Chloroflexota bacterium]
GAIDAPLIYLASIWWRTAHPDLNIGPLAESSLDSDMLLTFVVALLAFTLFYIYLLWERVRIRMVEDTLDEVYQYASVST